MSRISGSQNFTPVSTDSTDETSEVSSSSASEQVCSAEPQYSPVDTIQAQVDSGANSSHAESTADEEGEAHPAYLLQATGGAIPEKTGEKPEAAGEEEKVELERSHAHSESEHSPSSHLTVYRRSVGEEKWEKKPSEQKKSKGVEIEMTFAKFDKSSEALASRSGTVKGSAGELSGEVNVGQMVFRGGMSASANLKEGELAFHESIVAGYDLVNARVEVQSHLGGVNIAGSGNAMVGAEVDVGGQAELSWKEKKVNLAVGAGVTFASASGEIKAEKGGVGVVGKGKVEVGFAARLSFDMEFKNGELEIKADEEVAVGLGESASAAIEINPEKVGKEIGDLAHKALGGLQSGVMDFLRSQIDDHFAAAVRMEQSLPARN